MHVIKDQHQTRRDGWVFIGWLHAAGSNSCAKNVPNFMGFFFAQNCSQLFILHN